MKKAKKIIDWILLIFNFIFEFIGLSVSAFINFWLVGTILIFILMFWALGLLTLN